MLGVTRQPREERPDPQARQYYPVTQERCSHMSWDSIFQYIMIGTAHLNAFVCLAAASFSSLSFFSFCAGGVPVRLEAPESSPALAMLLGPRGFRVLDPRGPNIEGGPSVGAPVVDGCRDPLRPNRRRSSRPTIFLWCSGGAIPPN